MAHQCPDCGQLCYCGGDIDDGLNNFADYVIRCRHYFECQREDNDVDIYEDRLDETEE